MRRRWRPRRRRTRRSVIAVRGRTRRCGRALLARRAAIVTVVAIALALLNMTVLVVIFFLGQDLLVVFLLRNRRLNRPLLHALSVFIFQLLLLLYLRNVPFFLVLLDSLLVVAVFFWVARFIFSFLLGATGLPVVLIISIATLAFLPGSIGFVAFTSRRRGGRRPGPRGSGRRGRSSKRCGKAKTAATPKAVFDARAESSTSRHGDGMDRLFG